MSGRVPEKYQSASEIADLVTTREISAVEILDRYLNQINEHEEDVHAFNLVTINEARAAAKERGDDDEPQSPQSQRAKLRDDADAALNQAWDLYYTVFRRVNKQLPQLTTLELRYVSPALLNARSLELAVPGTYRVDGSAARIARFSPSVHVITCLLYTSPSPRDS